MGEGVVEQLRVILLAEVGNVLTEPVIDEILLRLQHGTRSRTNNSSNGDAKTDKA
jgi:hypothetical protein